MVKLSSLTATQKSLGPHGIQQLVIPGTLLMTVLLNLVAHDETGGPQKSAISTSQQGANSEGPKGASESARGTLAFKMDQSVAGLAHSGGSYIIWYANNYTYIYIYIYIYRTTYVYVFYVNLGVR